jgi:hypothetical protein
MHTYSTGDSMKALAERCSRGLSTWISARGSGGGQFLLPLQRSKVPLVPATLKMSAVLRKFGMVGVLDGVERKLLG